MVRYVALLRGMGPANPNMRGEKLRKVFEGLGFENVRTVLASGNVLFESRSRSLLERHPRGYQISQDQRLGIKWGYG